MECVRTVENEERGSVECSIQCMLLLLLIFFFTLIYTVYIDFILDINITLCEYVFVHEYFSFIIWENSKARKSEAALQEFKK